MEALAQPAPKPLSKADVVDLLKGDVPAARVGELARERGIDFQVTPANEDELRRAGANDDLLAIFRDLAPKGQGIQIEVTPGDAEVYVDDERVGKTSEEGRLRISKLESGEHRIRLSLDGYKSFEKTVEVKRGENANISTQLQKLIRESPSGTQTEAPAGDARALLDKIAGAFGGKAKIKSVRAFRLKGNLVLYLPQGETRGELDMVFDFTGRVWQRFTTTSGAFTLVVTPTTGFTSSASGTQDMPILQRNEILKNVWRNGFYVAQHADDPTFTFTPGGTAVVGGVTTEILDVAGAGAEARWFIDPNTGFIMRETYMEMGTGTPADVVDDFTDWRPVGGILVPFKQSSTRNGQMQSYGEFSEIEVNPRIAPGLFVRPGQ